MQVVVKSGIHTPLLLLKVITELAHAVASVSTTTVTTAATISTTTAVAASRVAVDIAAAAAASSVATTTAATVSTAATVRSQCFVLSERYVGVLMLRAMDKTAAAWESAT